jgi:two-component system chemotaxis response regulator CheB
MSEPVVRVLVVDDSAYMRKALREMLNTSPEIEVMDTARSGEEALEKTAELHPDVVTVDLYMPDMDGLAFIQAQMARRPLPIVVCSSAAEEAEHVLAAIEAGAVEFVQKPTALALESMYEIQQRLVQAVRSAALVDFKKLGFTPLSSAPVKDQAAQSFYPASGVANRRRGAIDAVLIGISTGGPRALRTILPHFPASFPVPLVIVQHMPVGYTQPMARKLDEACPLEVLESCEGLEVRPGRIILAQAGMHTRLRRNAAGTVETTLSAEPHELLYRPAVDELFRSAAEVYGGRLLGVVMTGMGNDGAAGAAWIKAQGGLIFAEAESTSIIFGMPRSVIEAGLADRVAPLDQIPQAIMEAVQ